MLKDEWGFEGVVVSDWFGTRSTAALGAGLDLEMPGPASFLGPHLVDAVADGTVRTAAVQDAADRTVRLLRRLGSDPPVARLFTEKRTALARQAAAASIVLLKNESSLLPLDPATVAHLAVSGPAAARLCPQGAGAAEVTPPYVRSRLPAILDRAGAVTVTYEPGAGGMAAAILLSIPRAGGLLRRAICMSGPVAQVGTAEQAQVTARTAAEDLGIRLTCRELSEVPIERLLEAQARLMPFGPGATPDLKSFGSGGRGMLPLAPCVDGDIVPLDPLEAVRKGAAVSKDLLAGTTTEEFNMVFALMGADIDEAAADRTLREAGLSAEGARAYLHSLPGSTGANILGQAATDRMFRVPTEELCDARCGADGRTYRYQSAWRSPAMGGILGAAHCVDVPFVFDNLDASGVETALGSEPPQALADQMHRAWVRFVTVGDPSWPAYRLETRPTMVFDGESTVVNDPLRLPRTLWGAA